MKRLKVIFPSVLLTVAFTAPAQAQLFETSAIITHRVDLDGSAFRETGVCSLTRATNP